MNQWDVFMYPFTEAGLHPAIVLSPPERCANTQVRIVNALIGVTLRAGRPLKKAEILLDGADGLDWETAVRCDVIHALDRGKFRDFRGQVSVPRRREIGIRILECFRFPAR